MIVTILPSIAHGIVTAPPSKSVTLRSLICGALSPKSTIHNISYSQDVEATLRCLEAMGAVVSRDVNSVTIGGLNPFSIAPHTVLDCGESGTTLRFLLPLCLLSSVPITLTGSQKLFQRPLDVYETLCRERNISFVRGRDSVTVCGPLYADHFTVRGDVSSQFISGLMLALPLLSDSSTIDISEPFESKPYVALTREVQHAFGVTIDDIRRCIRIRGNGQYRSTVYTVEGDYSNAAPLEAFNLIGGDVKVIGLSEVSSQGDRVYRSFFDQLTSGELVADLSDCPDLGPILFSLAPLFGVATFNGISRLRLKESDRVAAMLQELAKFGVTAVIGENSVAIGNASMHAPKERLSGHNDHRIVMALSVLCSKFGGTIEGADAVNKSYPDFFNGIQSLGVIVHSEE